MANSIHPDDPGKAREPIPPGDLLNGPIADEIAVMRTCAEALHSLPVHARSRVVRYLADRFGT